MTATLLDLPSVQAPKVRLRNGPEKLEAEVVVPANARGIVVFVHGCGSSRHSPRDCHMAQVLLRRGYGTMLVDLLTSDEEMSVLSSTNRNASVHLLAYRLRKAIDRLAGIYDPRELPIALIGTETGAAAALRVAADRPNLISAIVSRSRCPDLASDALGLVHAPTLFLVSSEDDAGLVAARNATNMLNCLSAVRLVAGATPGVEEPHPFHEVELLTLRWLDRYLKPIARQGAKNVYPDSRGRR